MTTDRRPPRRLDRFAPSALALLAAVALSAAALLDAGAPARAQSAGSAADAPAPALNADMKAAVRAEIRAYLLENPELIVEAMEELERRRELAQAERRDAIMSDLRARDFSDALTFVGGNPEGDLTLVEFVDYNCPACKAFSPAVQEFLQTDGQTRYVAVVLPFQGAGAETAARAALASKPMMSADAHAAFHQALLDYQGRMNITVIRQIAAEAGLDTAALETAMQAPEVLEEIQRSLAMAQEMGVNGTPTYAVGDEVFNFLRGQDPVQRLASAAAAARAAAQ